MQLNRATFMALLAAALLWPGVAPAGPIGFNSALTLSSGEFVFREQGVLSQSGDDPSGADRDRRSIASLSVLGLLRPAARASPGWPTQS